VVLVVTTPTVALAGLVAVVETTARLLQEQVGLALLVKVMLEETAQQLITKELQVVAVLALLVQMLLTTAVLLEVLELQTQ
jgi:hypothetical protein